MILAYSLRIGSGAWHCRAHSRFHEQENDETIGNILRWNLDARVVGFDKGSPFALNPTESCAIFDVQQRQQIRAMLIESGLRHEYAGAL